MHSNRVFRSATIHAFAIVVSMGFLTAFSPGAEAASSVLGTIVELSSNTRTILLRVGYSDGVAILHRFEISDSARIRVNGGPARFADILVGRMARIAYVGVNGRNVAELVEVMDAVPAPAVVTVAARDSSAVEPRERYLEEVASTLDVLEEDIEELAGHELEGTGDLARLKATIEDLETKLADARALLKSLSATASQDAWRAGVDAMNLALAELNNAHDRGRSAITNR